MLWNEVMQNENTMQGIVNQQGYFVKTLFLMHFTNEKQNLIKIKQMKWMDESMKNKNQTKTHFNIIIVSA